MALLRENSVQSEIILLEISKKIPTARNTKINEKNTKCEIKTRDRNAMNRIVAKKT